MPLDFARYYFPSLKYHPRYIMKGHWEEAFNAIKVKSCFGRLFSSFRKLPENAATNFLFVETIPDSLYVLILSDQKNRLEKQ